MKKITTNGHNYLQTDQSIRKYHVQIYAVNNISINFSKMKIIWENLRTKCVDGRTDGVKLAPQFRLGVGWGCKWNVLSKSFDSKREINNEVI